MTTPAVNDTHATAKPERRWSFPSAFTILFLLTLLAVGATWLVPAGSYAKLTYDQPSHSLTVTSPQGQKTPLPATQNSLDKLGVKIDVSKFTDGAITKPVSIPHTYERLEQNPAGLADITTSMVNGTVEAADIIVFILILGGLIGVVKATGAFDAGLIALTQRTKGREFLLVSTVSVLMVLGGTSCGLEEEAVAFYPILVPIFIAMGYDAIICVGAIFLAGSMGTTFSTINPFSVVIASNAAGTQFTEGIWWRASGCAVGAVAVIAYLWWYARKIKADPSCSYTYTDREKFVARWQLGADDDSHVAFDWRRKIILVLFVTPFPLMVWGVMAGGWWFPEMAASFLAITIGIMLLAATGPHRLSEKQLVDSFTAGASSLVGVSLIIGLARGINLVMNNGLISDTMLDAASNMVQGMNGPLFIVAMLFVFFFLGFVVPSSSGLAVLAMPIMAPLGDTVGIDRWIIVCAYQWGQYAMLFLAPTGLVMATLQMLDISFSHWVRFVWPMVVFVLSFGGLLLITQVFLTT
ncbi:H+/gluconate symporter and related permeases [Dermatophilus congolensis]|uniref:H+/gluconate symporter and related permeases n=1 Tax=Dermatophilus congolensis TaxID=1863 RepID=A0A239VK78_9MICO|nr:YfcC family protein [Dermatophilus congolensis]SNV22220.1 H+/gluconate symporter and related permeases [Dermatophilus congolensis]